MSYQDHSTLSNQAHLNSRLADARALIQSLLENRKKAWQKASFFNTEKRNALATVEHSFSKLNPTDRDAHYLFFYYHYNLLLKILPGSNSRYHKLGTRAKTLIDAAYQFFIQHNPKQ